MRILIATEGGGGVVLVAGAALLVSRGGSLDDAVLLVAAGGVALAVTAIAVVGWLIWRHLRQPPPAAVRYSAGPLAVTRPAPAAIEAPQVQDFAEQVAAAILRQQRAE